MSTFELYDLDVDLDESNDLLDEGGVDYDLMRTMLSKLIEVEPCPKTQQGQFFLSGGEFFLSGGEQKGEAVTSSGSKSRRADTVSIWKED